MLREELLASCREKRLREPNEHEMDVIKAIEHSLIKHVEDEGLTMCKGSVVLNMNRVWDIVVMKEYFRRQGVQCDLELAMVQPTMPLFEFMYPFEPILKLKYKVDLSKL